MAPRAPRAPATPVRLRRELQPSAARPRRKGKCSRATGGASAAGSTCNFGRVEQRRSAFVAPNAPCSATTTYECPDRELAARGSILDVAVREPKLEDRRGRNSYTVLRLSNEALLGVLRIETLNVNDLDELLRDLSNQPEHAPSGHRVADRRNVASGGGEVVLEVTAWEADHERLSGHRTAPLPSCAREMPVSLERETAALRRSVVRTLEREGVPDDRRRQLVAGPVLGVLVPLPSWCEIGLLVRPFSPRAPAFPLP